jgi:hypothetical protein
MEEYNQDEFLNECLKGDYYTILGIDKAKFGAYSNARELGAAAISRYCNVSLALISSVCNLTFRFMMMLRMRLEKFEIITRPRLILLLLSFHHPY